MKFLDKCNALDKCEKLSCAILIKILKGRTSFFLALHSSIGKHFNYRLMDHARFGKLACSIYHTCLFDRIRCLFQRNFFRLSWGISLQQLIKRPSLRRDFDLYAALFAKVVSFTHAVCSPRRYQSHKGVPEECLRLL